MATTGLFSGVDPELIRQQEAEKRQGNNLALAQSSNPFASTMFTGLNLADELRNKTADVFGNPISDSPAVAAAKEEKLLEEEVARMVMEGRQAGKKNSDIAQEVQAFLQGKGKFNKAEQMRTNLITEEQAAAKSAAEVEAKKAQALKDTEAAGAASKASANRKAGLKKKFPEMSDEMATSLSQDEGAFKAAMVGEKVETSEGVYLVFPDGSKVRIGSAVDRSSKTYVDMTQKGNQAFVETVGKELPAIESSIQTNNQFIGVIQQAKDKAIETIATKDRYTGGLAEAQRFIASALDSLGMLPPNEVEKLVKSDAFASEAANLLLTKTGGKIGAGFSNSDKDTIEKSIGTALQNPRALLQILTNLEKTTKKTNQYLRDRYERGRISIQAGAPQPLDSSFDAPEAPKNMRVFSFPKGSADAEAYKRNPEYRASVDAKLKAKGQVYAPEE